MENMYIYKIKNNNIFSRKKRKDNNESKCRHWNGQTTFSQKEKEKGLKPKKPHCKKRFKTSNLQQQ